MQQGKIQSNGISLSEVNSRLAAYRMTLENLKKQQPSEAAKIRRYGRLVQQLENCASDLSKGKRINAEDLPPPLPASLAPDAGPTETGKVCLFSTFVG